MFLQPEDLLKLVLALAVGALIGTERELRDKAAGLRTLMFICAGSAVYTIISGRVADATGADHARITAQIVSGVGFLGAGVILREHGEIRGLTTAAMIWLVAALGMGIGAGLYDFSLISAVLVMVALVIFPKIEQRMNEFSQVLVYRVTFTAHVDKYRGLIQSFQHLGLRIKNERRSKCDNELVITWVVAGRPAVHEVMITALLEDPEVRALEV